jgi:hypothetical protein
MIRVTLLAQPESERRYGPAAFGFSADYLFGFPSEQRSFELESA